MINNGKPLSVCFGFPSFIKAIPMGHNRDLIVAIKANDTKSVVQALEQGADPNARDDPAYTVSGRTESDEATGIGGANGFDPALLVALRFEYDQTAILPYLRTLRTLHCQESGVGVRSARTGR
jgi:hypothetical protein